MLNLSKSEKYVILFLSASILLGMGIIYGKKNTSQKILGIKIDNSVLNKITSNTSINKVSINKSNFEELCQLPGIGPVIARRIEDYRDRFGAFESVDDIMNVKGIGQAKFNSIKDYISLE